MPESLLELSAVAMRRLIGAKEISPVELWEACLARIEAVNPTLNAVVALDPDMGRVAARAAEDMVMRGAPLPPLLGLPVGIKDLHETAGLRTTHGSELYAENVPEEDDGLVARLRAAGALIAAKTNTPEFGAGANTWNRVYGSTGNPFDPTKTCAGSSGGSAVALATDMLPLATGSDLGGSLRTPAGYCGVVGFRPSPGLVPKTAATLAFQTHSVEGPMARNVDDIGLLLAQQAEADPRDPFNWLSSEPCHPLAAGDLSSLRVAVSEDLGFTPVSKQVRRLFNERIERMADWFGHVERRDPPLSGAEEIFVALRAAGFLAAHDRRQREAPEQVGPNVTANLEVGRALDAQAVADALREHGRLYRDFLLFMEDYDVLLAPVATLQPFDKEMLYPREIDGQPMENYIAWLGLAFGITLTTSPSIALPAGLDENGLPFGLQVVGRRHGDARLLRIAKGLEARMAADPALARPRPDLQALAS